MGVLAADDFYAVLGVGNEATDEEIRRAFRLLARDLHPDRNSANDASATFQQITEAYATLSDPERRAAYDRRLAEAARNPGAAGRQTSARARPIRCSECGKITAQPRILAFRSPIGLVVWSRIRRWEGIYCAGCARVTALRASALAAVAGWWAVPLGPPLTVWAIVANALGGQRSPESDHRLTLFNAERFLESDNPGLAYALARQVRESSKGALLQDAARIVSRSKAQGLPRAVPALKDPWKPPIGHLIVHVALVAGPLTVIAVIVVAAAAALGLGGPGPAPPWAPG